MLILIPITGKLILIEFPINWLTMKVTDFVIEFSVAGLICSDRRNRLEDNMFELLVVAKSNKDLF